MINQLYLQFQEVRVFSEYDNYILSMVTFHEISIIELNRSVVGLFHLL